MYGAKVKWILRYILILLLIHTIMFSTPFFQKTSLCSPTESAAADKTIIYLFWGKDCHSCEETKPFLKEMETKYPGIEVEDYEVFDNKENKDFLLKMLEEHDSSFSGVPVIFIGDSKFQSFGEKVKVDLEAAIRGCLVDSNTNPNPIIPKDSEAIDESKNSEIENSTKTVATFKIPLIGIVDADKLSLPLITVILATVDSFNPCAFFVLFSLLGLLVHARSRKKILLIGSIFVFFSGFLYFLFIAAWLNLFLVFRHIKTITLVAGIVSVLIAVINIKDFFFFKRGISFTIPDDAKPKLFDRMRNLIKSTSLPSIVLGTIILAVAASFYELLCTAGFPMVFTRVLTLNNLTPFMYYMYLVLYTLVYVIPLMVIVLVFTITLGKKNISEWQGRVLKFVSGAMMLSLGLILILNPSILNDMMFSLRIFLGTIVGSLVISFYMNRVKNFNIKYK